MEGKINIKTLSKLLKLTGKRKSGVILGPQIGTDAAVFNMEAAKRDALSFYELPSNSDCVSVWKVDPITFKTSNPGHYAITINLNDLTCLGAIPFAALVTWLLPTQMTESLLEQFQRELHISAKQQNIMILGGHTEFTSSVKVPIIILSMIGIVPIFYLPSRNIFPKDELYLIGYVASEGTAILGHIAQNKTSVPDRVKDNFSTLNLFEEYLSIAKDGLLINKYLQPPLMHDGTEGGVLGAIYELLSDFDLGVSLNKDALLEQTHSLTKHICKWLDLNPLRLIASGTLLIIISPTTRIPEKLIKQFNHPIKKIGVLTKKKEFSLGSVKFGPPTPDELIKGLEKLSEII